MPVIIGNTLQEGYDVNLGNSGEDSISDIDDINLIVDGSTPTSATEADAISNVENNIVAQATAMSLSLDTKFGSTPGSNRLDVIADFIDAQTVPPDSLSDIDDINLLVDGSTPTSANEGAAITTLESNITTEAQGISDGLNALRLPSATGLKLSPVSLPEETFPVSDIWFSVKKIALLTMGSLNSTHLRCIISYILG